MMILVRRQEFLLWTAAELCLALSQNNQRTVHSADPMQDVLLSSRILKLADVMQRTGQCLDVARRSRISRYFGPLDGNVGKSAFALRTLVIPSQMCSRTRYA
jgi:hypothetical protein